MTFFRLEQNKRLFIADIALYSVAVFIFTIILITESPSGEWLKTLVFVLLGIAGWTIIEYALHRFILHSLQPFIRWHAMHHCRPKALIFAPTLLSAGLIAILIFLPVLLLGGLWHACALTLGLIMGYLFYTITHHAIHHWHTNTNWLKERKRCHALHHHYNTLYGCYGVTSAFWDKVFGSYTSYQQPKSLTPLKESRYDANSIVHH